MPNNLDVLIDEFVARSQELTGQKISERELWNTLASTDAIRHFAYGTSDDNPLWLDATHARQVGFKDLVAPPAFLCSVLYPFLHGAPMAVPLQNLIGAVEFEWREYVMAGDVLSAASTQTGVTEGFDRRRRRLVYIEAETTYRNQRDEVVGTAKGTLVRVALGGGGLLVDRDVYRYDGDELLAIQEAIGKEARTGPPGAPLVAKIGHRIPGRVRGPLTIGDLVCWQAAIGPSYRAGSLGYRDAVAMPHTSAVNPVTGWPTKYSQQHEDFLLASQRGMPAPFDNSLMRFAWIAPMITDWMGDDAFLKSMSIQTSSPILYGDTTWYDATISDTRQRADSAVVTLAIKGVNQLGETNTVGDAEVVLPLHRIVDRTSGGRVSKTRPATREPLAQDGHLDPARQLAEYGVLDSIEQLARETPEAEALRFGTRSVSCAEMNERSNRLAHFLQTIGAGPDALVAVLMQRTEETVIMLLAVLKAGAAFLPIEPDQPSRRLQLILKSAQPAILIADQSVIDSNPQVASFLDTHFSGNDSGMAVNSNGNAVEESGRAVKESGQAIPAPTDPAQRSQLVILDRSTEAIEKMPAEAPTRTAQNDDLAYIMTTSGTLRAPKYVAVSYGSLGRYIDALRRTLPVGPDDIYLHSASFAFSASVRQMFLPLCSGATVVVAGGEERRNPLRTINLIKRAGVTVWDTVPSVWRFVIEEIEHMSPTRRRSVLNNHLRTILSTGEALRWEIPRAWQHNLEHRAQMINLYSQTETAGTASAFVIPPGTLEANEGNVPLGDPLLGTTVHILDESLKPVEVGAVGEIFVGGPRLAEGYLGREDLTRERFISDPFDGGIGARLYRTGDRARRLPDGSVQYVGRADDRVNIRGQRIELAEIEEALREFTGVREAAARVWEGEPGNERLVGYVTLEDGLQQSGDVIRSSLRSDLPGASVPDIVIVLPELPRTASGKIDRTALPNPDDGILPTDSGPTPARTSTEEAVAMMTSEVLDVQNVDVTIDFFDLGANSLMVTRVLNRVRESFGVEIDLRSFFDNPSVSGVAHLIDDLLAGRTGLLDDP